MVVMTVREEGERAATATTVEVEETEPGSNSS